MITNLSHAQIDALDRALDTYKGNMILSRIENLLQERRFTVNPTKADREALAKLLNTFHDGLLKFLRDAKNVAPDWDLFPIARTWFTQRN